MQSNNKSKKFDQLFKSKYRSWLIIRLKTIKYKKNIFCYLSFYTSHFFYFISYFVYKKLTYNRFTRIIK